MCTYRQIHKLDAVPYENNMVIINVYTTHMQTYSYTYTCMYIHVRIVTIVQCKSLTRIAKWYCSTHTWYGCCIQELLSVEWCLLNWFVYQSPSLSCELVSLQHLSHCRLSERLAAMEQRLESSKLQLVWSVPPFDIGIYVHCWHEWCVDTNSTWHNTGSPLYVLYCIAMMVHCTWNAIHIAT